VNRACCSDLSFIDCSSMSAAGETLRDTISSSHIDDDEEEEPTKPHPPPPSLRNDGDDDDDSRDDASPSPFVISNATSDDVHRGDSNHSHDEEDNLVPNHVDSIIEDDHSRDDGKQKQRQNEQFKQNNIVEEMDRSAAQYGPPEWAELSQTHPNVWYGAVGPSHGGIDEHMFDADRIRRRAIEARRLRHIQQRTTTDCDALLTYATSPDRARLDQTYAIHRRGHLSRMAFRMFGGRKQAEDDLVQTYRIRARTKDLHYIEAMRLATTVSVAAPVGRLGAFEQVPCIVVDGAHCSACRKLNAEEREDLLTWCHVEARKAGSASPFYIVYLHSDADLSPLPDWQFFKYLHAVVGSDVRRNLQGLYVVHPNAHWFVWQAAFRLMAGDVWSKAHRVDRLSALFGVFPELRDSSENDISGAIGEHVRLHDRTLGEEEPEE